MLSNIKRNIINWYPFKPNSTVLEIGLEIGKVTEELCIKNEKVPLMDSYFMFIG